MSDFGNILTRMLGRVSESRDKRQGAVIYDTLAPVAAELAQMNINIDIFLDQTYLLTASGKSLDARAADYGITRTPATKSIRRGQMLGTDGKGMVIPIGNRFSTPNAAGGLNFILTSQMTEIGDCALTCETAGTAGNSYIGPLLPLFAINNLADAQIISTLTPGEDEETDEHLRQRILDRINKKAYGGNVADYKEFTTAITGVGAVKVFPVWNGGGTVKLSIVDSEYNLVTTDFITQVQTTIDPVANSGLGLGIAPIGHRVTVVTPVELKIDVSASLALRSGFTIAQVQPLVEKSISSYLLTLRKQWADSETLSVFIARTYAAILEAQGVDNVTNLKINGSENDLTLTQTPTLQQLPIMGGVTLTLA